MTAHGQPLRPIRLASTDPGTVHRDAPARQMQRREQIDALAVTGAVTDGGRHERPVSQTITGQRPKPSASSSSARSEVSARPVVIAPNQAGGHGDVSVALASRCTSSRAASGSCSTRR